MDREPPAEILAFLADIGAINTPHHAGRSLQTHLVATWEILTQWDQPDPVAIAGLCHSVYGTDAFETACLGLEDRKKVSQNIGDEAEQISFLFGAMQRQAFLSDLEACNIDNRFSGSVQPITKVERSALCHILLANELDLVIAKKGANRPDKVAKKAGPVFAIVEPFLSDQAKTTFTRLSTSN